MDYVKSLLVGCFLLFLGITANGITIVTNKYQESADKDITVISGEIYEIKFDALLQNSSIVRFTVNEGVTTHVDDNGVIEGENSYYFTPQTNTVNIRFQRLDTDNATRSFTIDNLSYSNQGSKINEHCLGVKTYEVRDHLRNVRMVLSDKQIGLDAKVVYATDYFPYGMELTGRTHSSTDYRYGFNGMERDDKMKGNGNSYDFGARIYDTRIGKWLAIDPLYAKYPGMSPYNFVGGMVTIAIDPDGEVIRIMINKGNTSKANEVLGKLKKMTNDKLDYVLKIEGNKTFYEVKIKQLCTENSSKNLAAGSDLIKHLVFTKVNVDISAFTEGDYIKDANKKKHFKRNSARAKNKKAATNGVGSGTNIWIDENAEPISLGHELIHAELNAIGMQNRHKVTDSKDTDNRDPNKKGTTDGNAHVSEIQTRLKENQLRDEQQLDTRPPITTGENITYPITQDFYKDFQEKVSEPAPK